MLTNLERGNLYEVKFGKRWIVAEYLMSCESRLTQGYRSIYGAREWMEPAKHCFKGITFGSFSVQVKGSSIRPVSIELMRQVTDLKERQAILQKEIVSIQRELRLLCE